MQKHNVQVEKQIYKIEVDSLMFANNILSQSNFYFLTFFLVLNFQSFLAEMIESFPVKNTIFLLQDFTIKLSLKMALN